MTSLLVAAMILSSPSVATAQSIQPLSGFVPIITVPPPPPPPPDPDPDGSRLASSMLSVQSTGQVRIVNLGLRHKLGLSQAVPMSFDFYLHSSDGTRRRLRSGDEAEYTFEWVKPRQEPGLSTAFELRGSSSQSDLHPSMGAGRQLRVTFAPNLTGMVETELKVAQGSVARNFDITLRERKR